MSATLTGDSPGQSMPVYRDEFKVTSEVIDQNGHVNNVAYVQWMQDIAIGHSDTAGGTAAMQAVGGTWVVRSHKVEYLASAALGDVVCAVTWVVHFSRVTARRRYKFVRDSDRKVLARGETQWVFVDGRNGRPRAIPETIIACCGVLAEDWEPG